MAARARRETSRQERTRPPEQTTRSQSRLAAIRTLTRTSTHRAAQNKCCTAQTTRTTRGERGGLADHFGEVMAKDVQLVKLLGVDVVQRAAPETRHSSVLVLRSGAHQSCLDSSVLCSLSNAQIEWPSVAQRPAPTELVSVPPHCHRTHTHTHRNAPPRACASCQHMKKKRKKKGGKGEKRRGKKKKKEKKREREKTRTYGAPRSRVWCPRSRASAALSPLEPLQSVPDTA
eukprot:116428-Rhodomonas_salina.2